MLFSVTILHVKSIVKRSQILEVNEGNDRDATD